MSDTRANIKGFGVPLRCIRIASCLRTGSMVARHIRFSACCCRSEMNAMQVLANDMLIPRPIWYYSFFVRPSPLGQLQIFMIVALYILTNKWFPCVCTFNAKVYSDPEQNL